MSNGMRNVIVSIAKIVSSMFPINELPRSKLRRIEIRL